jgi:hypothetical protein
LLLDDGSTPTDADTLDLDRYDLVLSIEKANPYGLGYRHNFDVGCNINPDCIDMDLDAASTKGLFINKVINTIPGSSLFMLLLDNG